MARAEMMRQVPPGYKEAWVRFLVADVGATMVATQMDDLPDGTAWILKDVEIMFRGTVGTGPYLDINTVATKVAATEIGGRYYQTLSALHWDGDANGPINGDLTAKPYLQLCAGVGAEAQVVEVTAHCYYK